MIEVIKRFLSDEYGGGGGKDGGNKNAGSSNNGNHFGQIASSVGSATKDRLGNAEVSAVDAPPSMEPDAPPIADPQPSVAQQPITLGALPNAAPQHNQNTRMASLVGKSAGGGK
jgi:hypothetical protein